MRDRECFLCLSLSLYIEREEERDRECFVCKKHGKKTPVKSIALCVENTLLRGGVE
jgi:hypothetical protein